MTDPQTPATAVLEVLTNEGWVADPDATEYNLRVVAHVLRAALAEPPALDVGRLARAMRPVKRLRDLHYRDGTVGGFREEYEQPTPEEVARAYAEDREP